jgi:hypothetical protein
METLHVRLRQWPSAGVSLLSLVLTLLMAIV